MASCHKKEKKKGGILPDSSIYSSQNFTDILLDSTAIVAFFKATPVSDSLQSNVSQFYARREGQFAWFNKQGMNDASQNFHNQLQNYSRDFDDTSLRNSQLEALFAVAQANGKAFLPQKKEVEQLELLLTTTFFKYAQKVYGGTTKNTKDLEWFIPRKKKNYQILLDSLVSLTQGETLQEPVNQYYILLKEKLRVYRAIQKKGGFPLLITDKKMLSIGASDACLLAAKQHLWLTGDLKGNDKTMIFTDTLAQAVQVFQHRMGISETGSIDKLTLLELNRPIDFRIRQMMINMERLRWVPVEVEKGYLLINIPEFKLHVFENSKQAWVTNVVVGKEVKQTSIFRGNLSQITLNPSWGIPTSIVKNEILPHIERNANYLEQNNMEVIDGNYRQKPGKNNALGKMKFLFPNNFNIYLHDTPSKGLFGQSKRAFSHGCIRVENPKRLALYLLRNETNWNVERIDEILKTNNEIGIRIKPTVPVYIVYFTAWVDNMGQMNFRNDLYGLDKKLSKEIFGQ